MDTKLGQLQASLGEQTRRTKEEEKERRRLFLSEKSFKVQLRHRPRDSEKPEDVLYQLNVAVAKECVSHKAVQSLQSQLGTV